MRRLLLLRHAHAKAAASGQSDHDRPLRRIGRQEAAEVARQFTDRRLRPDLVLCSTALRTRETLDGLAPALPANTDIRYLPGLFDGPDYLATIRAEAGEASTILVVGHNPSIQQAAANLASGRAGRGSGSPAEHFPPAAFAVLSFEGAWPDLDERAMTLEAFVKPPG